MTISPGPVMTGAQPAPTATPGAVVPNAAECGDDVAGVRRIQHGLPCHVGQAVLRGGKGNHRFLTDVLAARESFPQALGDSS